MIFFGAIKTLTLTKRAWFRGKKLRVDGFSLLMTNIELNSVGMNESIYRVFP
jgi:hypothetical protein